MTQDCTVDRKAHRPSHEALMDDNCTRDQAGRHTDKQTHRHTDTDTHTSSQHHGGHGSRDWPARTARLLGTLLSSSPPTHMSHTSPLPPLPPLFAVSARATTTVAVSTAVGDRSS